MGFGRVLRFQNSVGVRISGTVSKWCWGIKKYEARAALRASQTTRVPHKSNEP